ncbi:MAG: hypothetical protein M1318_06435 [Firmicutes bacterium]|jgi:ssDNA-binding Zn-finger/Zn-ribbon topoisomerase 1|nr:hypothetical protein [Bacillota bacterium]
MDTIMICPRCRANSLRLMENRLTHDDYLVCDHYPYCSYVTQLDAWIPRDLIVWGTRPWPRSA